MLSLVVGFTVTTAQYYVGVWVANGLLDDRVALRINGKALVRVGRRTHGINRDLNVATGSILEPHRRG